MLHANGEPPQLAALGEYSPICDEHGVDFMFLTPHGLVGVQRKAVPDLVASLRDHRFVTFLERSLDLHARVLLVEGPFPWEYAGKANNRYQKGLERHEWEGIETSVQYHGVSLIRSGIGMKAADAIQDTGRRLIQLERWYSKEEHGSLRALPKSAQVDGALRVLQSLDGCSLKRAEAIKKKFGGVPLTFTVTFEEMCQVPLIGKDTARRMSQWVPYLERVGKVVPFHDDLCE